MTDDSDVETTLTGGGRNVVTRKGGIVFRQRGPWSETVQALLRHLERAGFDQAPRVVGTGFDARGLETLTYIEGEFVHPHAWSDEAIEQIGAMLRRLHDATATFVPPHDAIWREWFGRSLGGATKVFGHCDLGPWNIVARNGTPSALIDWEVAGPVDPLVEFSQACWLNVQLHDDDIAEKVGLPSLAKRARQMRLMADAYGLDARRRADLVETMIEFAVQDAASQVIEARVTPVSIDISPLWAVAWRTRAAAWMLRNRALLKAALA